MAVKLRASIGFGFAGENWERAVDFVVEAERLGVDAVWCAEAWGSDAVTPLGYIAARTKSIKLGSGIIQAGTRTPALVGMTAMTLQSISNGRFLLGLGTSGPQVIEGWHGIPFDRPVQRMKEIIDIVRIVQSGERVAYKGRVYELPLPGGEGKAIRSSMGASPHPVTVYLATLGPRSLEMTGAMADGWLGTSFMPEHAEIFFEPMRKGASDAGRSFEAMDLQAGGVVAFGDDIDALIAPRKAGVAFTLGAMGSREHNFYNMAYQRAGYEDLALKVQATWIEGDRAGAASMIPDEIVVQTNLLGNEESVKERIRAYRDCGVTTIRVDPEGKGMAAKLETLGRFMRLLESVNSEAGLSTDARLRDRQSPH